MQKKAKKEQKPKFNCKQHDQKRTRKQHDKKEQEASKLASSGGGGGDANAYEREEEALSSFCVFLFGLC